MASAPALKPESATFTVKVEPNFVRALEKLTADGETTIEDMLAGWIETTCMELNMGEEMPVSEAEMAAVARGIAQADRGECVPQEEVMAAIKARHGW